MKNFTAKVSILIPAYNTEKFIAQTIESIINQTYQDWELIIVDDNSNDDTYSICKEYALRDTRIKLYKNKKNLGMMKNWIYGISLCKGEYWGKLDCDDLWHLEMVEECVRILDNNLDVGMVFSKFIEIDEKNIENPKSEFFFPEEWKNKSISFIPLVRGHPTSMFRNPPQGLGLLRRSIFDKIGTFVDHPAGDTEMWFRIGGHYKIHLIDKLLYRYRVWSNSFSKTQILSMNRQDKFLFEARNMIYQHYLSNGFMTKDEFENNTSLVKWRYNFSKSASLRKDHKILQSFVPAIENIYRNPYKTFIFYMNRLKEKGIIK